MPVGGLTHGWLSPWGSPSRPPPRLRGPLVNDVNARVSDWDVLFKVQKSPALAYLTYTTSTSPGSSQWSVKGIYLYAASSMPEVMGPGVFNPGEEMAVLANPSSLALDGTPDRITFVTPDGQGDLQGGGVRLHPF